MLRGRSTPPLALQTEKSRVSLITLPYNAVREYDSYGCGAFGASRGKRPHLGTDFVVSPRELFPALVEGTVIRRKQPYADDLFWQGLLIQTVWGAELTLFYLTPLAGVIGAQVQPDEMIGAAQDIRMRYPADAKHPTPCTPHVHAQLVLPPQWPLPKGWEAKRDYIDYQNRRYANVESVAKL